MRYFLISILVSLEFFLWASCNTSSTGPYTIIETPTGLEFKNVPWQLHSIETGYRLWDLSTYKSFQFLVGDTLVYGYDGCNWYHGKFETNNATFTIDWIGSTELGCIENTINSFMLVKSWKYRKDDSTLTFTSRDTTIVFASHFTLPVSYYSFVGKDWTIQASNDTSFNTLRALNLLPKLRLTVNREFVIQWWFDRPDVYDTTNGIEGAFGLGAGKQLELTCEEDGIEVLIGCILWKTMPSFEGSWVQRITRLPAQASLLPGKQTIFTIGSSRDSTEIHFLSRGSFFPRRMRNVHRDEIANTTPVAASFSLRFLVTQP